MGIQINSSKGSGYAQIQLLREGNTTSNSKGTGCILGVSLKSVYKAVAFGDKRIWNALFFITLYHKQTLGVEILLAINTFSKVLTTSYGGQILLWARTST